MCGVVCLNQNVLLRYFVTSNFGIHLKTWNYAQINLDV
jgi:hypothetical protein